MIRYKKLIYFANLNMHMSSCILHSSSVSHFCIAYPPVQNHYFHSHTLFTHTACEYIHLKTTRNIFIHCISVIFSIESPRFRFMKPENYTTVYHQQETDVLYLGGQGVIYKLTFSDKGVHDTQVGGLTQ